MNIRSNIGYRMTEKQLEQYIARQPTMAQLEKANEDLNATLARQRKQTAVASLRPTMQASRSKSSSIPGDAVRAALATQAQARPLNVAERKFFEMKEAGKVHLVASANILTRTQQDFPRSQPRRSAGQQPARSNPAWWYL